MEAYKRLIAAYFHQSGSQQIHSEFKRWNSSFLLCSRRELYTVSRGSRGLLYPLLLHLLMRKQQCLHYCIGDPLCTALPACHRRKGFCRSGLARNVEVDPIHGNMTHWARESRRKNLFLKLSTQNRHKYFWTHKIFWKCHYIKNHYRRLNIGANFSNNQAPTQTFRCTSCNCEIDRYMVSKIIKQIKGTKISQRLLHSESNLSGTVSPSAKLLVAFSWRISLSTCPAQRLFSWSPSETGQRATQTSLHEAWIWIKPTISAAVNHIFAFPHPRSNVVLPSSGIKKRKKNGGMQAPSSRQGGAREREQQV